jgi:hypothetical protein
MRDITLFRLAGLAAIAGGLLRAANNFVTGADPAMLQWDYIVTDAFLLFGLVGIYLKYRSVAGWTGLAGFATGAIGLLLVRSSRTLDNYKISAAVTLVGVALLGATMAAARGPQRVAGLLFLAALAVAIAGVSLPAFTQAAAIAGILFGAGFVIAGVVLVRAG